MLKQYFETAAAPSRRGFLVGASAIAGGFMVGFRPGSAAGQQAAGVNPFQGYVSVTADGAVTVYSAHMDMGQGIYHGVATLLNEELGADWATLQVVGAAGNPKLYGNMTMGGAFQLTGGSTGLASSYDRYRMAGAVARQMLVNAAAAEWKVPAGEIRVENGVLSHRDRRAGFGTFAARAAALPVPADVRLKAPADWRYIGKDRAVLGKFDARAKSTGRQDYTIDVKLPGLLTAVMIHPPVFGGKLKSFDAAKAKAMRGVVDVVAVPRGVAVVADNMWRAIKAREAVTVEWDETGAELRSSDEILKSYHEIAAKPGAAVAQTEGDAAKGLAGAAKVLEATFEFPYLAHAALEPLNAVARITDGIVEVWGGLQAPDVYQMAAAEVAGVTPDKVKLHVMKTGGGFGRRAVLDSDIITEAVSVSKALGGKPVRVQWTREDDMRGGRYRPAYVHRLKAGLDAKGAIVGWQSHIVGQSIMDGTMFGQMMIKGGVDPTSVEGAVHLPYALPNVRVELTSTRTGVPVLWWRAVGSTHTAYAVEAFMDELAEAAGKDPVAFRLGLMQDKPRHAAVLKLAAEKAGWDKPAAAGTFRGVALAESFHTIVAQVVELTVKDKVPSVRRVVAAVDCGVAVNPDNIRAQIEGGIGFGLGAVLKSRLTLDKGRVVEGNFDGYEVLRLEDMPKVEVHIVPSTAKPTGVGEPGVPPIGPALANAFYAATKRRVRLLPFNRPENA